MPPANPPKIAVRALSRSFGSTHAVRDVSFDVPAGEFLALVGASGSRKTTTLKMLNRLIEPTAGEVLIDGADVAAQPGPALRRRIGYAFQGVGLFPHMTVAENIAATPRLLGWTPAQIQARTEELLDLVELPAADYAARLPAALSGGQRQRIGFARALAARPEIMLMDEPSGALDPLTRDALREAYLGLHRRLGLTTVMVTHDLTEALLMADRIGVMEAGALIAIGTPEALLAPDADPYVRDLFATPRRQAQALARRLNGGAAP